MLSTHQHTAPTRATETTDFDLELQRRGNSWDLDGTQREIIAQAAELLGREDTARRLRETTARRERPHLRAAPPAPGRPLKAGPPRAPLLMAVPDAPAPSADEQLMDALGQLALAWATRALSEDALRMLVRIDRAASAATGRPPRLLQLLPPQPPQEPTPA
jgi:hypothetical protein